MPTVGVKRDLLFKALGKTYSDDEFQSLCFEFGLELDEVTTEKQMITKEQGAEQSTGASEEIIYRIDVPANRYDLLCLEGLVTGLLIFQEKMPVPRYKTIVPKTGLQVMRVTDHCAQIRPYVVCAILRDVTLTKDSYNSFIDLQDKLHQNICRKRSLVSIGTHDLDTIVGPFTYDAKSPNDIRFIPLNQEKLFTGNEIMDLYANHAQLKAYLPIIKDSPVYPIVYDANGVVMSLPPIINGDHSKITLKTKNILIECTATDLTKAKVVLDTIVCAFSEYCRDKYTAESVKIVYPGERESESHLYPDLNYRSEKISCAKATNYIGVKTSPETVAKLLSKMCLETRVSDKKNGELDVEIPPTRHDVIHACDIYEDVAIAWGYNKIVRTIPKTSTIGQEFPLNKLSDQIREELAHAGFTEALTFSLCSREDVSEKLGHDFATVPAVTISNPKTLEFQVARTCLLPGLLKTLAANKKMPLPLRLFEVSDVVLLDPDSECGARNERRLGAIYCNKSAGFQVIHGLLDRVMQMLQVPWSSSKDGGEENLGYYLEADEDPTYFPQRCARIMVDGQPIGKMGVLHPDVLSKFDLGLPCSAMEINLELFL
ncbi:phenylalanine--tRNA ligase beta subunit [Venturia canescens]|uniref:phenylalanine--tRNA ligase beta subunit n=1 Tax=Venturia canescens TaxID=32260 RepID=UPI001C9C8A46|nr:phenylalanine--tRNA ligase beta subunit [Venturia canescens]